ncbi:MAG TPA: choice-of-anchor B family protein [Thermoanaerobaculia bacterium]|nr:choice-of-anchor B family protein [Thermoanaerobaculia bacterium]
MHSNRLRLGHFLFAFAGLAVLVLSAPVAGMPPDLEVLTSPHEGHEGGPIGGDPNTEFLSLGSTACQAGFADIYPCSGVDLQSFLSLADLGADPGEWGAGLWGWTDPETRREYALIALRNRVSFVDITDPRNPWLVGDLLGRTRGQSNREVNVYANHAFVVADGGGSEGNGLQVFDLRELRRPRGAPVRFAESAFYGGVGKVHNFNVNPESGFGYAVGGNCNGGLHIFDIRDPRNPTPTVCWTDPVLAYIHDVQCVIYRGPDTRFRGREICFASAVDALLIIDVTDKANPQKISRTSYEGASYTHQAWLTEDHKYLVMDDEGDEFNNDHNTRTYLWKVLDLTAPDPFAHYEGATRATDHNQYVHKGQVYQANYRAGLRILDASKIASGQLTEVGFFDIVPAGDDEGFDGAWNVYPFYPSGSIAVSGIGQGLYVLKQAQEILPKVCKPGPDRLCLAGGRFLVDVDWRGAESGGKGKIVQRGKNFGAFTFGGSGIDLLVKTAGAGRRVNLLYGPLTNIPFSLRVVDIKAKKVTRYSNGPNNCGGIQPLTSALAEGVDPDALLNPQIFDFAEPGRGISEKISLTPATEPHEAGTCKATPTRLCLHAKRYAVETRGPSGTPGRATRISDNAGTFAFKIGGGPDLGVTVAEADGETLILRGSVTNRAFTVLVTDTVTGETSTSVNPAGTFCGGVASGAF